MSKTPTIQDVARVAGVSVASVSRVLNGSYAATGELQEKILSAVQQTGYKPQRVHKGVAKTPWLPVLTAGVVQQFDLQVIAGIQEQAEQKGIQAMMIRLTDGSDQLAKLLHQMRSIPMAGIVSISIWLSPAAWIEHYDSARVPIVVLNTEVDHPKIASILVNFEAAAAQATQHLLDLGHTRIVYLSDYEHPVSEPQLRGIRSTLGKRGLEYPEDYKFSIPMTPEGVSQGVSRIMRLPREKRPTAIFAFDDDVAIDTLNALRYYGLRVPEDISVLGFDNVPMAAHTYPPLTTVDVPKRRMGMQLIGLLEKLAKNEGPALGSTIVDGQLVVRGSTGPAPH